jgi:hypothetical protein
MKSKQLPTKQELHELFEYRDGELYWRKSLNRKIRVGNKAGTVNELGYCYITFKGIKYLAHRIIYSMFNDVLTQELQVDHRDNNPGNNKIENLRISDQSENMYNRSMNKNNTSGIKGVFKHKKSGKWLVRVSKDGITHHGGYFADLKDAKQKVEDLRKDLHKEFANHG